MKFFTIFAACMLMVLSVFALEAETETFCPGNAGATFEACISQYGGYDPRQTECQSKAQIQDLYNSCLGTAYFNLLRCFDNCPNHPRKAYYESYFNDYKQYYTPVTAVPTTTVPAASAATQATVTKAPEGPDDKSGASKLYTLSLSAVLCMVAYLLY